METKEYTRIGEKLWHTRLENGLHIYVDVKPDFSKSFAFSPPTTGAWTCASS